MRGFAKFLVTAITLSDLTLDRDYLHLPGCDSRHAAAHHDTTVLSSELIENDSIR
jgi:hypothetical protein